MQFKGSNEKAVDSQDLFKLLEQYEKSLNIYKKFKSCQMAAETFIKIGEIYEKLMDYNEALDNYFIALNLYRNEKNLRGESQALMSLGNLWEEKRMYSEAREYYEMALNIFKRIRDVEKENIVSFQISRCYQAEGSLEDAINILQKQENLPLNTLQQDETRLKIGKLRIKLSKVHLTIGTGLILLFYLIALVVAELLTLYFQPIWGILFQLMIIISLITHSSLARSTKCSYLLQAMVLIPLLKIMSLSIPVMGLGPLYWLAFTILPVLVTCLFLIRSQNIRRSSVGLNLGSLPLQLGVGFSGLVLGFIEYLILQPNALIPSLNMLNLFFASIIIILTTGLTEELVFRGIIQKNAENLMGKAWGLLYVSLLFTSLYIGWNSILYLSFVFGVSIIYGYVFQKTRSILGVSLSHGLSNIILFLVLPFLF